MSNDSSKRRAEQKKGPRRQHLNQLARDASKKVGLTRQQHQEFHRYITVISDDDMDYTKLIEIARGFKS